MIGSTSPRSIAVRHVTEQRVSAVLAFYERHPSEHLWPRSFDELREYAEAGCLWAAYEGGEVIGACYAAVSTEPDCATERHEFGGVLLADSFRGTGVSDALALATLVALWLTDPPKGRLIAHVHEENGKPRSLLNRSGFTWDGSAHEIPPAEVVPASMKRNSSGEVVGHLFVFVRSNLGKLATWLRGLDANGATATEAATIVVEARFARTDREAALEALSEMASS